MVNTPNENIVTEEEKKDTARFQELNKKADRTVEEDTELEEIKGRHGSRAEKRIAELSWRSKAAEERATQLEEKYNKTLAENEELKRLKEEAADITRTPKEEYIVIGNKKYLTNVTLEAKIKAGDITREEAEEYAFNRDEERIIEKVEKRREAKEQEKTDKETRGQDAQEVLKEHPEFDKKHKDHNPEDPLFKLANELWRESYYANSKGLTLALNRAKQILRINDTPIDRSNQLGVESSIPGERGGKGKEEEVTLTAEEQDAAIKMWTRGDMTNPKTSRAYTPQEALAKALEGKKRRER